MPEDKDFLERFKTRTGGFGSLIKELVADTPRLLINLPVIGRGRKISRDLEEEPFSVFYKYERTLANKLHPFLYRHNLNYITNGRIERFFHKKFTRYEMMFPRAAEDISHATYDDKLQALSLLKRIITSMAAEQGHFMVIKFYDYIYSTMNRTISDLLRSIEFKLNYLKPRMISSDDANLDLVRNKYREFKNIYSDHDAELLIERMKWDPVLAPYARIIEKEEESGGQVSASGSRIERYASLLKKKYLDQLNDGDTAGIEKVISAITRSNEEQHGNEKAQAIISDIVNAWLSMESLSEEKKKSIRSVTGTPESPRADLIAEDDLTPVVTSSGDALSDEEMAAELFMEPPESSEEIDELSGFEVKEEPEDSDEGSSSKADELLSNDLTDFEMAEDPSAELSGFDIAGETASEAGAPLSIADEESSGLDEFAISEKEGETLNGSFDISEPAQEDELDEFAITDEIAGREGDSLTIAEADEKSEDSGFDIAPEVNNELQKLFQTVKENSDRLTESYRLKADAFDLSSLSPYESGTICNSDILRGTRPAFLAALEHQGDDIDLFLRIVRYLERGPFPNMTLSERIRLLDTFIEKFKKNSELVEKLTVYRNTMTSRQSLLDEVFNTLHDIETHEEDRNATKEKQLAYLRECLLDEKFSPVWRTLQIIYENTARGNHEKTLEKTGHLAPGEEVLVLNRLKEVNRSPELQEKIESQLASEKLSDAAERYLREKEKNPDSMEEVLRQVMKEDLDLDSWISRFDSSSHDSSGKNNESVPVKSPGEIKKDIKTMLTGHDWSEADTGRNFSSLIKGLIAAEQEKALPFLSKLLSHEKVSEETRQHLLESLNTSSTPLFTDTFYALKLSDGTDDEEKLFSMLMRKYPEDFSESVAKELKKFLNTRRHIEQSGSRTFQILEKEGSDFGSALKIISGSEELPEPFRSSATQIHDDLTTGNIDQAIRSITILTSPPLLKAELLEKLKTITMAKDVAADDPIIQKIERKISFYRQIVEESNKSRKHILERKKEIQDNLESVKRKTRHGDSESDEGKAKAKSGTETSETGEESQLLTSAMHIVKNFSDNIDSLEPVLNMIKGLNSEKDQRILEQEVQRIKGDDDRYLSGAIEMIEKKALNKELLSDLQKISPRGQYRWAQSLQERTGVKKFEEAFNPFLDGKKLPDEINRLVRVIYSNNQNNFLKDSLDREKKLIEKIAVDFSADGLSTLRKKTRNSQDREKIGLFRDFIKTAGESPAQRAPVQETPLTSPSEKQKKAVQTEADNKPGATPSKKQKDDTVEAVQGFLSSEKSKSEMVRQSSKVYANQINEFFKQTAAGDQQALGIISRHPAEFTELFSYILRKKKQDTFPQITQVVKHCLKIGIIRREEL